MNTISKIQKKQQQRHVSIDVDKSILDMVIYEKDRYFQVKNNTSVIAQLIKKFKQYKSHTCISRSH